MTDDNSTLVWRLGELEKAVRDLGQQVVSKDLHGRDVEEIKRRLAEIERDIAEEKLARQAAIEAERNARKEADRDEENDRKAADQEIKTQVISQGTNWRQALYSGLIPGALFLLGLLWQLRAGTGK